MKLSTLFGYTLKLRNEAKYLGMLLHCKLNWSQHMQVKINKARRAFLQYRAAIRSKWGLSPEDILWLYEAIIELTLWYGARVWWPRIQLDTEKKHLNILQESMSCRDWRN